MTTLADRKLDNAGSLRDAWSPMVTRGRTPAEILSKPLPLFGHSLSVVSWGFNEEESIGAFVERMMGLLRATVADYELIVVDDGSSDRTPEILAACAEKYPRLKVIVHPRNRGIGEALMTAIEAASKDFFVWQTVDWSYDISRFREFLELLCDYDVVAGVRTGPMRWSTPWKALSSFYQHLTSRSDNIKKGIVSLTNYGVVRTLFQFPMSDYQNVVFYPTQLIKSLNMQARSSFANPELLMKAYWRGASIVEVPIRFCPREKGEAKGTRAGSILKSITDILKLWQRWVLHERLPFQGRRGKIRRLRVQEWVDHQDVPGNDNV